MAQRVCAPLDSIVLTENKPLDQGLVRRAAELLRNNPKAVPPALATFERTGAGVERFHIEDGHHRAAAAKQAGVCLEVINVRSMSRADRSAYTRAVNKYRKLIDHPVKRGR